MPICAAAIPVHSPTPYLQWQSELTRLLDAACEPEQLWCEAAGVAAIFLLGELEPAAHSDLRHHRLQVRPGM